MFENYKTFKTTFAGRELMVETGKVCGLANGSCWVHYGETVVMVNVTASAKPREGVDFFPLAVDYEEKLYAVGKIPGGYLKREGRPSEKAILNSRVVDRPMRPLFPKDMRNDVAIVMTVLAVDPETQPEIIAMIGASIAVSISDIPWNGPIGGISVGLVDGEIVLMPDAEQRAKSDLQLTVASSEKKVVMIEAGANEVDVALKLRTIENLDSRAVGPVYEAVKDWDEPVAIAVLPDHPTPCELRTHTNEPVPFFIWYPGIEPDSVQTFDEIAAVEGSYGLMKEDEFIKEFMNH